MHYFKTKNKLTLITLTIIILTLILCLSFLAKTEVYFFLYDDPETVIIENINKAEVSININTAIIFNCLMSHNVIH